MRHLGLMSAQCLCLPLLFLPCEAAEQCVAVDAQRSEIVFSVMQAGNALEGAFREFHGDICFQDDTVTRVNLRVAAASAETGVAEADASLRSAAFLDAANFPYIVYESERFMRRDEGMQSEGTLEIKGKRLPQASLFNLRRNKESRVVWGELLVQRLDFDVGTGEWADINALGSTVRVRYRLSMTLQP